jgi:hypothetical protein
MSRYISQSIRLKVAKRANYRCEYCLLFERHSLFPFHIDHIVSLKHSGENVYENLAFSCSFCNSNKGTDLGTFLDTPSVLVRFYNPRTDIWGEHFQTETTGIISPKTIIAEATLKIFDINQIDTVIERRMLIENGLF